MGRPKNRLDWSLLGLTTMPRIAMLRKPPLVSVPSFTALQWLDTMQFWMVTSSHSRGDVDFSVMPSSSESAITSDTMTS